jgi:hypothetical protein
VSLSRPIAAFFSTDNTKAYILSCGYECGGSSSASVTEIDTTSIKPPASPTTNSVVPATVLNQWTVNGARIGLIDQTANKLYVAGSNSTLTDQGGNTVQNGYFTIIDLTKNPPPPGTIVPAIPIGNGVKKWIRNINGVYWVASLNCGLQSCVTLVNPSVEKTANITSYQVTSNVVTFTAANSFAAGDTVFIYGLSTGTYLNGAVLTVLTTGLTSGQFEAAFTYANVASKQDTGIATVIPVPAVPALPNANGDATGISLSVNSGEVYTIEGGQLYIYKQNGSPVTSQYTTDIKGQGSDVLYID